MPTPTLQDVFGLGATQTATTVTFVKEDFPTLTPKADNNGQEIYVGIKLKAMQKLNPANRATDPDIKVEISYGGQTVYPGRDGANDRQDTYTEVLHKDVPAEQVDADDY